MFYSNGRDLQDIIRASVIMAKLDFCPTIKGRTLAQKSFMACPRLLANSFEIDV
jgi:hypothetical protein